MPWQNGNANQLSISASILASLFVSMAMLHASNDILMLDNAIKIFSD